MRSRLVVAEDEEEQEVVVGSIGGALEAWGCVLLKFTDKKNWLRYGKTGRRTHPLIEVHGRMTIGKMFTRR